MDKLENLCVFCGSVLPEEICDANITYSCSVCGAELWLEVEDELHAVSQEAAAQLNKKIEEIDIKIIHYWNILTKEEDGDPDDVIDMALVFARVKKK